MTFNGFIPVLTHRYPLDALLTPYVERYAPAPLISAAELRAAPGAPLPALPLMIDSGGYQALDAQATAVDVGPFAALHLPGELPRTPLDVYDLQRSARAAVSFTLDFPAPANASTDERARRLHLGERNALWALSQICPGTLYASVQPGEDLTEVLAARPNGIALGGLALHSADRDRVRHEIRTVRAATLALLSGVRQVTARARQTRQPDLATNLGAAHHPGRTGAGGVVSLGSVVIAPVRCCLARLQPRRAGLVKPMSHIGQRAGGGSLGQRLGRYQP